MQIYSKIVATGSFIPERKVSNNYFLNYIFYDQNGNLIDDTTENIIKKFYDITNIEERRYALPEQQTSDLAYLAAKDALESSGIDKETLDYIIVAHNFGDISIENPQINILPTIACKVKEKLKIKNPNTIAYDILFGCPGWLQGLIQANYYIKSGDAKRVMIIGADTLSRVSDVHDRDSMIYADGAGATILEAIESNEPTGILSHKTRTDAIEHAYNLWLGPTYNPEKQNDKRLYIKMNGHKIYEYALTYVPEVVKQCIDEAKIEPLNIKKILIHQANAKMDIAILKRILKAYKLKVDEEKMMPLTIGFLGNSSTATIPTMLDLIFKNKLKNHHVSSGDHIVFASVGAGMHINAIVYKIP